MPDSPRSSARSRLTNALAPGIATLMLRTSGTPLRAVWAWSHRVLVRGVAAHVRRGEPDATVYVKGSFATGEPLYGVSDVDLVVVARGDPAVPGRMRERVRARWRRLCDLVPPLSLLMPHFWIYEDADLAESASGPSLTYGLATNGRAPGFPSRRAVDEMELGVRPGLGHPCGTWRRVRGRERRPAEGAIDESARQVAAWLELQYWWRYAYKAAADPGARHVPFLCVKLVAEPLRILWWLERGERIATRAEALRRGIRELPEEARALRATLDLQGALPRSPEPPLSGAIGVLTRFSNRIARLLADAAEEAGGMDVRLEGGEGTAGLYPLVDWRARAGAGLPDEVFSLLDAPAEDLTALASAARAEEEEGAYRALRAGELLLFPTLRWARGTMRTVQSTATDPVSFALLDGAAVARFPDLAGWSARDSALRAVAEHAAWLEAPAGNRLAALGKLLTAVRAALFLESALDGEPVLPLTIAAAARMLRGAPGGEVAEEAVALHRSVRERGAAIPPALLAELERVVRDLPAYRAAPLVGAR